MRKLIGFFKEEDGATAVEYAIMVGLIAAVIIGTVIIIGTRTDQSLNKVIDNGL